MQKRYFVYMLASRRNGTLYTGVTGDLPKRIWEHKNNLIEGFMRKYGVHFLVWFEEYGDIGDAIAREKQIKGWNRAWKIKLVEKTNSGWNDLYEKIAGYIEAGSQPGSPSLGTLPRASPGMTMSL